MHTLGELAERLGLTYRGDAGRPLLGLATLAAAGPEDLSFLSNNKYLSQLADTRAGAVILHPDMADQCPTDCLISESPYVVFGRLTHGRAPVLELRSIRKAHQDAR